MRDDDSNIIVLGLILLFLVGMGFGAFLANTTVYQTQMKARMKETTAMIEACEAELPRNEFCKLVAVPKNEQ